MALREKCAATLFVALPKYVYDSGIVQRKAMTVETLSGIKKLEVFIPPEETKVRTVRVDMGPASFLPQSIPVKLDGEAVIARQVTVGGRATANHLRFPWGSPRSDLSA